MDSPSKQVRTNQLGIGFIVGVLARFWRFAGNLVVTRMMLRRFGDESWGLLSYITSSIDLVLAFDLAIHELAAFQVAATPNLDEVRDRLRTVAWISLIPATLGVAALGFAADRGVAVAHSDAERDFILTMFGLAALNHPVAIVSNVVSGTVQGLGWIREINLIAIVNLTWDAVCVLVGIPLGLDLLTIQALRMLGGLGRAAALAFVVRRQGLPLPSRGGPDFAIAPPMFQFAAKYGLSKALGNVIYSIGPTLGHRYADTSALAAWAAADQLANKTYRFSHGVFESMFHRLAWAFRAGATNEERDFGRSQYVGATHFIAALVIPGSLLLSDLGPRVFGAWLGKDHIIGVELLAPLLIAWSLNAVASPSSCVLLSSDRFRESIAAHVVAIGLQFAVATMLGPTLGITGVALSSIAANLILTTLLIVAARWHIRSDTTEARYSDALQPLLFTGAAMLLAWPLGGGSSWTGLAIHALAIPLSIAMLARSPDFMRLFRAARTRS